MFFLFCSWFLLQNLAALNAGECPIYCRSSTLSGNSCCICAIVFLDGPCNATCHQENEEACFNCMKRSRVMYRKDIIMLVKNKCLGCHYYENYASDECMACPFGCVSCFDNTLCYECVNGMYGEICNKRCGKCRPDNQGVVKCDSDSGKCTNGCVDGFYSPRCDHVCGHCNPDNKGVVKCETDSGTCTYGCVDGYYGPRCDRVCSGMCSKRSCSQILGFCDNGCVSGWYGDTCNKTCSDSCSLSSCNQRSGFCDNGCVSGWYSDKCEESCSNTCYNKSCDQYTGSCVNGCISGWYGDMCNEICSDTCYLSFCNKISGFCRNGCVSGWHGDTCRESCSSTCYNKSCDQYTGNCANGCVHGWYGHTCNKTCSDTCSLNYCNQRVGFCEKGCVSGWHGYTCELLCSRKCYNKSCDQYTGRYYNGCATAHYGDTCDFNCVDACKERACDRKTSQCLRGCVAGYQGAFCNMTMTIGPDSVLVGFTSSLAGVTISLVFALIIWFIRRVVLRGKRYDNLQVSTRDTSAPIYDEILDTDDTTEIHRVSGSHLYTEVCTAHTPRSIHESGPNTRNNCDTKIACNWIKTLSVVETFHDTPLVCTNAFSMSTLHSEVSNYNNSDVIHTSSFVSLDNSEVQRKSSNRSRKYYEIPDIIPSVNHNIKIEGSATNDGYKIPISSVSSTAQNAEASGASLSGQCNIMADSTTSPTRNSKRTQNKDLFSSRNKEINVNDINQPLQKTKEDKRNSSSSGFDIDIPLETHQTQEKVTEGDSNSLNYIHPVN